MYMYMSCSTPRSWAEIVRAATRLRSLPALPSSAGPSLQGPSMRGALLFWLATAAAANVTGSAFVPLLPDGNFDWALGVGGTGPSGDGWDYTSGDWGRGYGIVGDGDRGAFVTGSFEGTTTFGATRLTSAGGEDIFVMHVDKAGALDWVVQAGGAGNDRGAAIALDGGSGMWITGHFAGNVSFGSTPLRGGDLRCTNAFVMHVSVGGSITGAVEAGGVGMNGGNSVASDGAGGAWVAGFFTGTASFGTYRLSNVCPPASPGEVEECFGGFVMHVAAAEVANFEWRGTVLGKVPITITSAIQPVVAKEEHLTPAEAAALARKPDFTDNHYKLSDVEILSSYASGLAADHAGGAFVTGVVSGRMFIVRVCRVPYIAMTDFSHYIAIDWTVELGGFMSQGVAADGTSGIFVTGLAAPEDKPGSSEAGIFVMRLDKDGTLSCATPPHTRLTPSSSPVELCALPSSTNFLPSSPYLAPPRLSSHASSRSQMADAPLGHWAGHRGRHRERRRGRRPRGGRILGRVVRRLGGRPQPGRHRCVHSEFEPARIHPPYHLRGRPRHRRAAERRLRRRRWRGAHRRLHAQRHLWHTHDPQHGRQRHLRRTLQWHLALSRRAPLAFTAANGGAARPSGSCLAWNRPARRRAAKWLGALHAAWTLGGLVGRLVTAAHRLLLLRAEAAPHHHQPSRLARARRI